MTTVGPWKDWRGEEIRPGSRVIWPAGRNAWLEIREGVVEEMVDPRPNKPAKIKARVIRGSNGDASGGAIVTIERIDRVTVLSN